jgi:hypothetical protein
MTATDPASAGLQHYRSLQQQAAKDSVALISKVCADARAALRRRLQTRLEGMERDQLELSLKLLEIHTGTLCERYPQALLLAFKGASVPDTRVGGLGTRSLRFDQLERMDDSQVQREVELARAYQLIGQEVEADLMLLDTLVAQLLELPRVNPERNALRPQAYVSAFLEVIQSLNLPAAVGQAWLHHAAASFGMGLKQAYAHTCAQLRAGQSAVRVAPASTPTPADGTVPKSGLADPGPAGQHRVNRAASTDKPVLTLDRLRQLMVDDASTGTPSGFQNTVPAALEALQGMDEAGAVLARLHQTDSSGQAAGAQFALMAQTSDLRQKLSLEVVSVMLRNISSDVRLLEPVRMLYRRLEPALLRLVLLDPRFFVDGSHPARRLLHDIAEQALAYASTKDADFKPFYLGLQKHLSDLFAAQIEDAQPFDVALKALHAHWQTSGQAAVGSREHLDKVVSALSAAEQRNTVAKRMVSQLEGLSDMQRVPGAIRDFLYGPWAQVMATAQLKDLKNEDPGQYKELVNGLLWSAQPELTRNNVAKLTKFVPWLLSKLREGLQLIDYPSTKTSAFFDVLMKQHQQAFKPAPARIEVSETAPSGSEIAVVAEHEVALPMATPDVWVAPQEARATGFMEMPDLQPVADQRSVPAGASGTSLERADLGHLTEAERPVLDLSVGAWVEVMVKGVAQRAQLTWTSPQKTMFLFTNGRGQTLSMTHRVMAKLYQKGDLRLLAQESPMEGALQAVVQTAIQNSVDLRID